jgi:hypothetical protein
MFLQFLKLALTALEDAHHFAPEAREECVHNSSENVSTNDYKEQDEVNNYVGLGKSRA